MGWTGIYGNRKQAIEQMKAELEFDYESEQGSTVTQRILKGRFVGNHYYAILRRQVGAHEPRTFALVNLLQGNNRKGEWAWKSMTEDMGPYYHAFPLKWLDELDAEPPSHYAAGWRDRVRQYWAAKAKPAARPFYPNMTPIEETQS